MNNAKSIYEQTGWKRPHPKAICQDIDVLMAIYEYGYDLSNPYFLRYFRERTGINVQADSTIELKDKVGKILCGRLQDAYELFLEWMGLPGYKSDVDGRVDVRQVREQEQLSMF